MHARRLAREQRRLGGAGDGRQHLAQRHVPAGRGERAEPRRERQQTRGEADGVDEEQRWRRAVKPPEGLIAGEAIDSEWPFRKLDSAPHSVLSSAIAGLHDRSTQRVQPTWLPRSPRFRFRQPILRNRCRSSPLLSSSHRRHANPAPLTTPLSQFDAPYDLRQRVESSGSEHEYVEAAQEMARRLIGHEANGQRDAAS